MRTPEGWRLLRSPAPWRQLQDLTDGHGQRDLLRRFPAVAAWADAMWAVVLGELSTLAMPLSGLWLDKTADANWHVPWHQDLHAPMPRFSAPGWGPWSDKGALPHVQLPEPWCSRRLTLRLHLDPCAEADGPLEVIPGSHHAGVLGVSEIDAWAARGTALPIHAQAGDVLIMHPLLLHRSSPARRPVHRRVIQVEWCDVPLPLAARWLDAKHD